MIWIRIVQNRQGILYCLGAYVLWGVLPIYWKLLQTVSALEILAHRIAWSFVFLTGLILFRQQLPGLWRAAANRRAMVINGCAAVLITVNWGTYIWGVNASRIVETSLGYYINPLISVLLGVVFLRERLRPLSCLAVGLVMLAVAYLTYQQGNLPWVAVVLALSFALYGLMKKLSPLGALYGLVLETGMLAGPAFLYLGHAGYVGQGALGKAPLRITVLLLCTGVVTALPLLLFAAAARRIALSTIGLLQYISPTCSLVIGIGIYGESFGTARVIGFTLIWTALGLFWYDSQRNSRLKSS